MGTPFMSHDGTDSNGIRAEVSVVVGTGTVIQAEPTPNGKSFKVVIKDSHPKVRHPLPGFLNINDPLITTVTNALQTGEEISYRIEAQRKHTVDRSIPFADIPDRQTNIVRIIAAINGIPGQEAVTDPTEDPQQNPSGRIAAQPQNTQAASDADSGVNRSGGQPQNPNLPTPVRAPGTKNHTTEKYPSDHSTTHEPPTEHAAHRVPSAEAKPWDYLNSDGRFNTGSIYVQTAIQVEMFVREKMSTKWDNPTYPWTHTGEALVNAISRALLDTMTASASATEYIVNNVSVTPPWDSGTHVRTRAAIYDIIDKYLPIPFGETSEEYVTFFNTLFQYAVRRMVGAAHHAKQTPYTRTTPPAWNFADRHPSYFPNDGQALINGGTEELADETLTKELGEYLASIHFTDTHTYPQLVTVFQYLFGVSHAKNIPAELLADFLNTYKFKDDDGQSFKELVTLISERFPA